MAWYVLLLCNCNYRSKYCKHSAVLMIIVQTKLAFSRTWHHISAAHPHPNLHALRPHPPASSPTIPPPSLGRLASRIAVLLMGKHKPTYSPSTDCGDYVVVTNCSNLYTTGKKRFQKLYYRHNTRPGSLKSISMDDMMAKLGGGEVLRKAVSGMLPKNRLRQERLSRLKAFEGEAHPYKGNVVKFEGRSKLKSWEPQEPVKEARL